MKTCRKNQNPFLLYQGFALICLSALFILRQPYCFADFDFAITRIDHNVTFSDSVEESSKQYPYPHSVPLSPIVTDDGAFTTDNTQLHASWVSQDPLPIIEYQYAIGTAVGAADVVDWTLAGTATEITRTGLSLVRFQTYYFSVKSKNDQERWSRIGYSDGITVANQAPMITRFLSPSESDAFTEGEIITIQVWAIDPDDTINLLEYRFFVNGDLIQDWARTYGMCSWQTQAGDTGLKTIIAEVRDPYDESDSKQTQVYVFRIVPAPQ